MGTHEMSQIERVAVLGTGRMGRALAVRLASAGHLVILGSRDRTAAEVAAVELNAELVGPAIAAADYSAAVGTADIVVLAVPYRAQVDVLTALRHELQGKVLITSVIALDPGALDRVSLPAGSSAALEAQEVVGPGVPVVAAFQTLMYRVLREVGAPTPAEVWVAGDDPEARQRAVALSISSGLKTRDIGPLVNSIACEALSSVIMKVGMDLDAKRVGVRLTGIESESEEAESENLQRKR